MRGGNRERKGKRDAGDVEDKGELDHGMLDNVVKDCGKSMWVNRYHVVAYVVRLCR